MKAKLHFFRVLRGSPYYYMVWRAVKGEKYARYLGAVSKDPLRQVWTNNHEPRTYPTRLAAAKGLRLL